MKNWLKENMVLAIGLTLPLLLIVLFFVATVIPKSLGTPPQYEMLFSTKNYNYQNKPEYIFDFKVKNKQMMVKANKPDDRGFDNQKTLLMAYNGKTETVREISIDESKLVAGSEVVLDETKNMVIDTTSTSPDGYVLEGPNYNNGGIVSDLFGGRRNGDYRLKKGGVAYKIPSFQTDYYYNQIQFLGWVVKQ